MARTVSPAKIEEILSLYKENVSPTKIVEQTGVSYPTVITKLRAAGLLKSKVRPRSAAEGDAKGDFVGEFDAIVQKMRARAQVIDSEIAQLHTEKERLLKRVSAFERLMEQDA